MTILELQEKIKSGEKAIEAISREIGRLNSGLEIEKSKPNASAVVLANIKEQIEKAENNILMVKRNIELNKAHIGRLEDEQREKERLLKNIPDLSEMQRLSKLVLGHLKAAKEANEKLSEMQRYCNDIKEKTGQRISRPHTTQGFYSLKLLTEICQHEIEGKGRGLFTWDRVPVNLRRI